jgi:hypothetical protein
LRIVAAAALLSLLVFASINCSGGSTSDSGGSGAPAGTATPAALTDEQWTERFCDIHIQLAAALQPTRAAGNVDPATLTLDARKERARQLWSALVAAYQPAVTALDELATSPATVGVTERKLAIYRDYVTTYQSTLARLNNVASVDDLNPLNADIAAAREREIQRDNAGGLRDVLPPARELLSARINAGTCGNLSGSPLQ